MTVPNLNPVKILLPTSSASTPVALTNFSLTGHKPVKLHHERLRGLEKP